jgi:hypothetical protein
MLNQLLHCRDWIQETLFTLARPAVLSGGGQLVLGLGQGDDAELTICDDAKAQSDNPLPHAVQLSSRSPRQPPVVAPHSPTSAALFARVHSLHTRVHSLHARVLMACTQAGCAHAGPNGNMTY